MLQGGRWQFGLKDLGLATLRVSKMNIFPLQHDEKSKIKLLEEIEVKQDEEEQELPPKLN